MSAPSGSPQYSNPNRSSSPEQTTHTQPISAIQANSKPLQVKLVLLGEAAVGKSSLVVRFVNREYTNDREPTIGAAFLTQKCTVDDRTFKFEIWDTAGQERFHSLAPMYYRNAQAAIVMYDVTKASTLEKAKSWVKELQRQANPNVVIALVGNKIDLVEDQAENEADEEGDMPKDSPRQVTTDEAKSYADEAGLLFVETSAKTAQNVDLVFEEIARKVPEESAHARTSNTNIRADLMREGRDVRDGCAC